MSDDRSNVSEATNPDKKQRFSVYVPNPAASFQLGASDYANSFGYNGGALSVDPFLFIDVNKHTLYQSGTHSCWQVGGKWLQYANGPMYMTSLEHTTVGAGLKMLLVAGAAQGQITAVVHRKDGIPRIVEYNNLTTRYRVEEQANNVVRFLYGRKTVRDSKGANGVAVDGPVGMNKGMVAVSKITTSKLGLTADRIDNLVVDDPKEERGLSHFRKYYPYAKTSENSILKALYSLLNKMTRFRDVLQKYLWWITDNALVASITKVLEAANHFFNTYHNLASFINNSVMDFASTNNPETGEREWGFDDNRFAREATGADGQGWGARIKSAEGLHDKMYAKVTSGSAPYDFTKNRSYTDLTVEYDSGTTVFSASVLPTAAHIAAGAPTTLAGKKWPHASVTMPAGGTTLTITCGSATVPVSFAAGEVVTPAQMAAKIAAADSNSILKAVEKGGTTYVYASDNATAISLSWSATPSSNFSSATVIPGLGGKVIFLTVDHTQYSVAFSDTDLTIDDVVARFHAATGSPSPAVATKSGNNLDLLSKRSGAVRSNLLLVEQTPGVFSKIGISTTQAVGTNGSSSIADFEAVTLKEVNEIIATSGKGHMTLNDSDFVLKSNTHGAGSEVKRIADNPIASVLGLVGKKDKIDGDDFNMTTPGDMFQSMRATIFELNKLPEDTRNILRPLIEAIDDLNGVIASAAGVVDSLASIVDLWVPGSRDPSIVTLVGRDGISMGTNDALVGVASKGVCFYATGAEGVVDQRDFISKIEKPLSNVPSWAIFASISNLTELAPDDAFDANVGFQVRSASDVSLRSVARAELLAVGRNDNDDGIGVARVGGSYSAEVCSEEISAVTARKAGGRVELLGERITIGCPDDGLTNIGIKGTWDPNSVGEQVVTTDIQAEAKSMASIGAGEYMVYAMAKGVATGQQQRRGVLDQEKTLKQQEAVNKRATITQNKLTMTRLTAEMKTIFSRVLIDPLATQEYQAKLRHRGQLAVTNQTLDQEATAAEQRVTDLTTDIAKLDAEIEAKLKGGVLISARDPAANKRLPQQNKASFLLTETGITLRSSTQEPTAAEVGTKIDLTDDQVIITQGDKKFAIAVSASGIVFKADDSTKVLDITANAVTLQNSNKVDFTKASKILLG